MYLWADIMVKLSKRYYSDVWTEAQLQCFHRRYYPLGISHCTADLKLLRKQHIGPETGWNKTNGIIKREFYSYLDLLQKRKRSHWFLSLLRGQFRLWWQYWGWPRWTVWNNVTAVLQTSQVNCVPSVPDVLVCGPPSSLNLLS